MSDQAIRVAGMCQHLTPAEKLEVVAELLNHTPLTFQELDHFFKQLYPDVREALLSEETSYVYIP